MEQKEIWKDIKGYEGYYKVSSLGRIMSLPRLSNSGNRLPKRILSPLIDGNGYLLTRLYKGAIGKTYKVHRLVAEAFIPNPDNLPCINHKDEDTTNSNVNNLEWCTYQYNSNYGTSIKRAVSKRLKPVLMCNLSGEVLQKFVSIKEAQNFIGATNIAHCCKGHCKTVKGYIWKYAEE